MALLGKDFSEFIALLNENNVRYLVVGGYAVAFHRQPRYTKDLDVWVEIDSDNARRFVTSLEQFGFGSFGLREQDFLADNTFAQLGHPPYRIDILTGCDGVNFAECYVTKTVAGRPQNLADVSNLRPS